MNTKSTGCLRMLLKLKCSLAWGCFVVVLLVGVSSFQVLGVFGSASAFGEGEGCAEWVPAGGDRLTCQNVGVFEIKSLPFPSLPFLWGLCPGFAHWDVKPVCHFRIPEAVEEHSCGFYGWGEDRRVSETTGYFFHARNRTKENSKRYKL